MGLSQDFWCGRRVFLTGHTGFKGSWMLLMLRALGADVHGFALEPPTDPSMFALLDLAKDCRHGIGDILDVPALEQAMRDADPEIVIHMAAQPLVRASYADPVATYGVNVMGTVHVMDACRRMPGVRSIVAVTTDKCYENVGWIWGYRENDRLGGHDPYSNSKAAAELAVASYRDCFFANGSAHLASARAGNVIGGGDFAEDRLVPDAVRAFMQGAPLMIRNPLSIRPWQHVLEPLYGYLLLAERLFDERRFAEAWNFGPDVSESAPVGRIADRLAEHWGNGAGWKLDAGAHPHEAATLKLDSSKARLQLGWSPRLPLDDALRLTSDWYTCFRRRGDLRAITERQIRTYVDEQ